MDDKTDFFVATIGEHVRSEAELIATTLHKQRNTVLLNKKDCSLSKQVKAAGKHCDLLIVVGDSEVSNGVVNIRCLETGGELPWRYKKEFVYPIIVQLWFWAIDKERGVEHWKTTEYLDWIHSLHRDSGCGS